MSHDARIFSLHRREDSRNKRRSLNSEPSARVSTNRSLGMKVNPAVQSSYVKDDVEATSIHWDTERIFAGVLIPNHRTKSCRWYGKIRWGEVKFESSLSNQPRRTWDKSLTEVTKKQEKKFPMFQLRSHPGLSHLGRRYPARKGAQRWNEIRLHIFFSRVAFVSTFTLKPRGGIY